MAGKAYPCAAAEVGGGVGLTTMSCTNACNFNCFYLGSTISTSATVIVSAASLRFLTCTASL